MVGLQFCSGSDLTYLAGTSGFCTKAPCRLLFTSCALFYKDQYWVHGCLLCLRPVGGGAGAGALGGHRRPSSVRPSVCPSDVAYISSNSKTKRPRKTKLCDSHIDFKVKSQGHGAGAYCGGHLAAQLVLYSADLEDIAKEHCVAIHSFADDTQLYLHCSRNDTTMTIARLEKCIVDINYTGCQLID